MTKNTIITLVLICIVILMTVLSFVNPIGDNEIIIEIKHASVVVIQWVSILALLLSVRD